jgi:hypothetical protein
VPNFVHQNEDCQDGDDIETVDKSFGHRVFRSNRSGQLADGLRRVIFA